MSLRNLFSNGLLKNSVRTERERAVEVHGTFSKIKKFRSCFDKLSTNETVH